VEFVLDGSLTMAWCFEDEASSETDEIQDWLTAGAHAYVPTLWHLEIANVLWACERRNRITEADSVRFLAVSGGAKHYDRSPDRTACRPENAWVGTSARPFGLRRCLFGIGNALGFANSLKR